MEKNYQKDKSIFIKNRTIFIIGRSETYGKKIFFISDFFPRFLVEKEENIDYIISEYKDNIKEVKSKATDGNKYNYKNLGGEKELVTIFTYTTQDVVDVRGHFAKTYEANIKFTEVLKRKKLIKGYFYVPEYIMQTKTRFYNIYGVEYIMLFEKEIDGGELIF